MDRRQVGSSNRNYPGNRVNTLDTGDATTSFQSSTSGETPPSATSYEAFLSIHSPNFSTEDLVINPIHFPSVKINDLLDIYPPSRTNINRLVLRVKSLDDNQKGTIQISISKSIADIFQLYNREKVIVEHTNQKNVNLDFVHVHFKDQYLSRSDIWRFQQALNERCVYKSQFLSTNGHTGVVNKLLVNGAYSTNDMPITIVNVACGVVQPFTKFVFRSRSARIYWCFQMSKEMWDSANDAELYHEKAVHHFASKCFEKWTKLEAHHSLTILFFCRTFYPSVNAKNNLSMSTASVPNDSSNNRHNRGIPMIVGPYNNRTNHAASATWAKRTNSINVDKYGRTYEDVFQVVVENESLTDWNTLIVRLKKAIMKFPVVANWKRPSNDVEVNAGGQKDAGKDKQSIPLRNLDLVGLPSTASEGNFLEALNLTLNVFQKHHMDRDLYRTGQSVVLITAGTGIFHVDRHMVLLTKRRLYQYGVGIDLISCTSRPFHTVPLLLFDNVHDPGKFDGTTEDDEQVFFNIPHWLRICFPFDPCPLWDKFKPLPAYRMVELLPGENIIKVANNHSNISAKKGSTYGGDEDGAAIETSNSPPPTYSSSKDVNKLYRELPHALRVVLSLNPDKLNHNRFNVDEVEVEESISNNETEVMDEEEAIEMKSARHPDPNSTEGCPRRPEANISCKANIADAGSRNGGINEYGSFTIPKHLSELSGANINSSQTSRDASRVSKFHRNLRTGNKGDFDEPPNALTNTQLQRVESREKIQQKAWALRAYGVMRKPGIGPFNNQIYGTSSTPSTANRHQTNGDPQTLGKSNLKKTTYTSDVSASSDTNITGGSMNSTGSFKGIKRIDLRTRDDYNFHDMSIFEKKQMQRTSIMQQQQGHTSSFSLPPSHESTLASGSGNGNGLGSSSTNSSSRSLRNDSSRQKVDDKGLKSSLSLALKSSSKQLNNDFSSSVNLGHSTPTMSMEERLNNEAGVVQFQEHLLMKPYDREKTENSDVAISLSKSYDSNKRSYFRQRRKTDLTPPTHSNYIARTMSEMNLSNISVGKDVPSVRTFMHGSTVKINKTSSRWFSTLQTESPRKMLNKRWQVSSDSSGASYEKYNLHNGIGEGKSNSRRNSKGDNLQEGFSTTPPRSPPSTYFFHSRLSGALSPRMKAKAAAQNVALSNPHRKFMHSKYGKHFTSHYSSPGNSDSLNDGTKNQRVMSVRKSLRFSEGKNLINPFITTANKKKLIEQFTVTRRRWRHIYSKAFDALRGTGHLAQDTFSMDWMSLCEPAILPITTDYYPSDNDIENNFSRSFYTVALPDDIDASDYPYNTHEQLIKEMVCQRLQQEFQIVVASDGAVETVEKGLKYTLSLGNLIHKLSLDSELNNILVELLQSNENKTDNSNNANDTMRDYAGRSSKTDSASNEGQRMGYHFSLWEPSVSNVASHYQEFQKESNTNWNYLDQVVCGYYSDLPPSISDRRIRFVLTPYGCISEAEIANSNNNRSKISQERTWLFPWLSPTSDVQDPAVLRRRVQFRQDLTGKMEQQRLDKFMELCEWIENQVPMDGFKMDVQIVRMPSWDSNDVESRHCFTNSDDTAKINGEYEGGGKNSYRHQKRRPDTFMVKIPLNTRRVKHSNRRQWLLVEYDSAYFPERYYHFSIHFIVCSGKSVDDFVKSMANALCYAMIALFIRFRHTRRIGLELMQVPEYAHPRQPPYLHPFSQPLLIHLPLKKKQYVRLNLLIQDALLTRFNFIIESDVVNLRAHTHASLVVDAPIGVVDNISTLQLELHRPHQLGNSAALPVLGGRTITSQDKKRGWGGRQFLHSSGDVFVRFVEDGVLWIPNRLVERRERWERGEFQFLEFKRFCLALYTCYGIVERSIITSVHKSLYRI